MPVAPASKPGRVLQEHSIRSQQRTNDVPYRPNVRSEDTPMWAWVFEQSRVESAIVVLLIFLRESLSVVQRRECLTLAFIAADFEQLLAGGVLG